MIRRIYVKLHITMLHIKHRSFGSCGFIEEDFRYISIMSLWQIIAPPGRGQYGPQGHRWQDL